jgi:hypothetical protein
LTTAIILGFVIGSNAQQNTGGLFKRGGGMTRDDEAGLYLPGDGYHGIGGNADGTDTYFDDTNWDWESHLPAPLGSGALLLMGFGAAYAMSKRNKKD